MTNGYISTTQLPDDIGLDMEAVRSLLASKHGMAVPKDDPMLMLVTILNAHLAEMEKLHSRHCKILEAQKKYSEDILEKRGKRKLNMELFQRIKRIAVELVGSETKLATCLGMPQRTLNGYLNAKSQRNLWEYLPAILSLFPEIRRSWLYFGEGEMLVRLSVTPEVLPHVPLPDWAEEYYEEKFDEEFEHFVTDVWQEVENANKKHNSWWPNNAAIAVALLNEEVGKLTKAAIDYTYSEDNRGCHKKRMTEKVVSTAAMAFMFYCSIDTYLDENKEDVAVIECDECLAESPFRYTANRRGESGQIKCRNCGTMIDYVLM